MEFSYSSLLLLSLVAAASPLLAEIPLGLRMPIVVLEIVLGIAVGPHVLGWATPGPTIAVLSNLGLAFLFFLAGMEIDFEELRGTPLVRATEGWIISALLAAALVGGLWWMDVVKAPLLVGLALTTTAIGTLIPILRDGGVLETTLGRFVLGAGVAGEFFPILAMSVLFSTRFSTPLQLVFLLGFVALSLAAAWIALTARPSRIIALLERTLHATSQLPVRLAIFLMVALLVLAEHLGMDMILGAFAAGIAVGLATRDEAGHALREKLETIGFGFFIPLFFVATGIKFDLALFAGGGPALARVPLFLALLLVARGLPALWIYRRELDLRARLRLGLFQATALPLVVALTEIGLGTGVMMPENGAALLGAGMLSVLIFPLLGLVLRSAPGMPQPTAGRSYRSEGL